MLVCLIRTVGEPTERAAGRESDAHDCGLWGGRLGPEGSVALYSTGDQAEKGPEGARQFSG